MHGSNPLYLADPRKYGIIIESSLHYHVSSNQRYHSYLATKRTGGREIVVPIGLSITNRVKNTWLEMWRHCLGNGQKMERQKAAIKNYTIKDLSHFAAF
jgi:hypothetical protein